MSICGKQEQPAGGPVLTCACVTDDPCHIHVTAGGTQFIRALSGLLVFGSSR